MRWSYVREYGGSGRKAVDNGMYRKTGNSGVFSELPERMSKKHIRETANEFDISLKHVTIVIDADEEKLNPAFCYTGRADPMKIGRIDFFPKAFRSKEELVRTIYHEKQHVLQYREYGAGYVQANRAHFEDLAYAAENKFIAEMKEAGKL